MVIAIIGLLATIVMVSLNTARTKARDARRKADLATLATAIEMYNNTTGYYPKLATAVASTKVLCDAGSRWIISTPALDAIYMSKQPCDPTESAYHYYYISDTNGTKYELAAFMENDTADATNDGGNNATYYEVGTDLSLVAR